MPQLAPLTIKDGATTPANHIFTPTNIKDGMGTLVESSGTPIADKHISIGLKQSTQRYKPELNLVVPIVQNATVDGVTKAVVVRVAYASVKFAFENSSTVQERKDVMAYIADALKGDKTMVNDVIVNLQHVY